jgi:hypothetical protein
MNDEERFDHYVKHGWCPVPWKHHPEPIKEALRGMGWKPQLKQCFYNSQRFLVTARQMGLDLDLEYHEGYAQTLIPFEHAWLVYEGEVLDLTLPPDREPVYHDSLVFGYNDIVEHMRETEMWAKVSGMADLWELHPLKDQFTSR